MVVSFDDAVPLPVFVPPAPDWPPPPDDPTVDPPDPPDDPAVDPPDPPAEFDPPAPDPDPVPALPPDCDEPGLVDPPDPEPDVGTDPLGVGFWLTMPTVAAHGPDPALSKAAGCGATWARWFSLGLPATNVGLLQACTATLARLTPGSACFSSDTW